MTVRHGSLARCSPLAATLVSWDHIMIARATPQGDYDHQISVKDTPRVEACHTSKGGENTHAAAHIADMQSATATLNRSLAYCETSATTMEHTCYRLRTFKMKWMTSLVKAIVSTSPRFARKTLRSLKVIVQCIISSLRNSYNPRI